MLGPSRARGGDPRDWQIAFLAAFLAFVLGFRDFTLPWPAMAAAFAAGLGLQALLARGLGAGPASWKSALISCLSLCLLLRASAAWTASLAAALAIGSKFVLRWRGKHFFNPTNFGILATVLLTGRAWVSPAQWGSAASLAFLLAALGLLVTRRCGRLDVSLAYLGAHAALNLARVAWLGERPEVFLHRMSSGALVVFAFFMVSDPRSTPDARAGRVLFAFLVASLAHWIQFVRFTPSAPLWALALASPTTPLLDAVFRGRRFEWGEKGALHAPPEPVPARSRR